MNFDEIWETLTFAMGLFDLGFIVVALVVLVGGI